MSCITVIPTRPNYTHYTEFLEQLVDNSRKANGFGGRATTYSVCINTLCPRLKNFNRALQNQMKSLSSPAFFPHGANYLHKGSIWEGHKQDTSATASALSYSSDRKRPTVSYTTAILTSSH